jgi:Zn-dependent M28 family amino/carboxypeptidase
MVSKAFRLFTIAAVLAMSLAYAAPAQAGPQACDNRVNDTFKKLMECVTLAGVREHQAEFQAIADVTGGTRASGFPGYEASVDYVVETMTAAGYNVTTHSFPFVFVPPPVLQQLTPVNATYETGAFTGTGFGEVTAAVTPIDINLVTPAASTSGCQGQYTEATVGAPIVPDPDGPDDFAGFTGGIALVQRGSCSFGLKAINAEAAGASAVIIFNQGSDPTRFDLIVGTLGGTSIVDIPVVGASYANGVALSQAGSTAHVNVDPPQNIMVENVLAESKTGDPNNVVMLGAHLDSVQRGPGINDNGSGSAVLLEVAEQFAKVKPVSTVRFAWWGAEEAGLIGSTAYVADLSQEERDKITMYLNFDMVGSPNHVFFIYDGDNSDGVGAPAGPAGSAAIEKVFEEYYNLVEEPFKGTDFTGRSDYGPFIASGVGIPSGGLFTGAEGIKTPAEAAIWGGTAGQQYDPCYHLACDTYDNNNNHALDVNSDAVAYALALFAMRDFNVNPLLDPPASTTTGTAGSGGGLHDHHEEELE